MQNLHSTASLETQKAIGIAYDYILEVTDKQGHLMPLKTLYGDGSRFKPLTLAGFREVYNQIKIRYKYAKAMLKQRKVK